MKQVLRQCYVFTDIVSSFDIDVSKHYKVFVFLEKEDAVKKLCQFFDKRLDGTHLKLSDKENIRSRFLYNLRNGKYFYHFRDNRCVEEFQYFGKVHRRSMLWLDTDSIGGYPVKGNMTKKKINGSWQDS